MKFFKKNFYVFLIISIIIINIIFVIITKEFNTLGVFGSILGVASVALIAKGHISCFFFAAVSNILFGIIAFNSSLYGSMLLQGFYLVMQFIGIANWKNNLKKDNIVKPRKIDSKHLFKLIFLGIGITILYGVVLNLFKNRTPILDALVTGLAVTAMLLTVKRYQEAWAFWILANTANIILWGIALLNNVGNSFLMLSTLIIFLVGSIYGLLNWRKI